jgi:5-methylcytosine-specific restriction endonuclease McrA
MVSDMQQRRLKAELFDLQDGKCWICGKLMHEFARPGHPLAPSIDHIVPLSKGGKNDPSNKLLAHRSCNSERGNKEVPVSPWAAVLLLRFDELTID